MRVGVAVSGGADSVALFYSLRELDIAPLTILHINHGLRGAESEDDEEFVRSLAPELPFFSARAAPVSGNLEQHCRRERLRLFREWMKSGVVDRVATGHTATDQAETVLLRLLRGTGPTGLRGVLPVTGSGLIRPLIDVSRPSIRQFLRNKGWKWREDSSNADPRFLRNRVRAELLPLLRGLQPNIEQHLHRLSEIAIVEEDFWTGYLEKVGNPSNLLDVAQLRRLHPAVRRRFLRQAIAAQKGDLRRIEKQHLDRVDRLIEQPEGNGSVTIPGLMATRSFGWIRLTCLSSANCSAEYSYNDDVVIYVDQERLQGPLHVRAWQPGDRFQPAGRREPIPLKKLFQSARIPSWERQNRPIVTDGVSVIWLAGFGTDQRFAASAETRSILQYKARIFGLIESNPSSSTS